MSGKPKGQQCRDFASNDKVMQIAADPNEPGEILASLAEHECSEVRARVAANPNTPESALEWSQVEFPPFASL